MANPAAKKQKRTRRHIRVRARIAGTKNRPRAALFRSSQHVYVQLIDDEDAKTILGMSDHALSATGTRSKTKTEIARALGKKLGEEARNHGITEIVFDRGGFAYHGRVKAVAEGLREAGLSF